MKKELLAPNRKPSNLNAEQYDLVRTTAFKNWFGDWEKLALTKFYDSGIDEVSLSKLESKVSKVVDENGEPLVVYHGTTKDFTIFEMVDKVKEFEFGVGIRDYGAYFTNNKKTAQFYSLDYNKKTKESKLIEKKFQKALTNWLETKSEIDLEIVRDLSKKSVELGKDILNIFEQKNILMCFLNIKKPFVFDAKGKHWYKVLFGKVDIALLNKNDGVIMENMIESNSIIQNTYIIFEPNQIKLADGNNTEFDDNNPDIRFEQGGDIDYSNYKTAVIALFNDNRVLILKRGSTANWMPNKWSLVGGVVENNENPKKAVIRETFEEIGLIPENVVFDKNIKDKRLGNMYYYHGSLESTKVDLDYENSDYAFISESEIDDYDYVPYVKDYIKKLFANNSDIRFAQGGEINEEAQQLIDIISMNPNLEKYQKYKVLLKDKFGIDFDLIYKDQEYIDNATLNDIKTKDDFFDFGNWLQYAKIISKKRGFVPMDLYVRGYDEITDETWNETAKKLDFSVQKVEYEERGTGGGDIARAFGDTIVYTKETDLYYFLHEIGHIYDFQNVLTGIIKNPAYSPTNYGTTHSGETFAENFAIYFLNPKALKNWNEDVYYAMDSAINDKYKKELKKIVSEKSKYKNGGLIAPNGKRSNLTPTQYKLVRTPAFKKWFGDWENDPANASKVIDENGEPLVVYHGTNKNFNIFGEGKNSTILPKYQDDYLFRKNTNYFHKEEDYAKVFGSKYGGYEKPYFLNIRKIELVDEDTIEDIGYWKNIYDYYLIIMGLDGVYSNSGQYATLLNPHQIKLADGINTTFDDKNPDIRFEQGGGVFSNTSGENFWGNIGGGILPICVKTKRILVPLRSRYVNEPNQIGIWGGKVDEEDGENESNIIDVVKREFIEEAGYDGKMELIPAYVYQTPSKSFTYYNFIGLVDEEFTPMLNWETKDSKWITLEELVRFENFIIVDFGYGENKYYKHFGLISLLNDKNSMDLITKYTTIYDKFEKGGRTIAQTPAPKKDQVKGSDINKKSSSKDLSSAKLIKFDDKTLLAIKNKVKEHNEEHPDKKINLSSAKAVVRRGMGAYSKSHRPTISGGKPNSRVAWGLARLNAFTYKIVNGKSKSGKYSQDDDLIEELGYKVANYKKGGEMKDIRCINCGWEWNKKDSELWDMYVCHKCGFDNTTFYTSIPVNNYSKGGRVESKNPDYLKMFLGK